MKETLKVIAPMEPRGRQERAQERPGRASKGGTQACGMARIGLHLIEALALALEALALEPRLRD